MELSVVLSLLLFCGTSFADLSAEYDSMATLDGDSKYTVYWTHNATSDTWSESDRLGGLGVYQGEKL